MIPNTPVKFSFLFSAKEINQSFNNGFPSNYEVKELVFIIYGLSCPTNINQGSLW